MGSSSNVASSAVDRELVITRVFDAPRSLVFKVWTEPEHMAKWLGPQGFTGTILRHELRPGGAYRYHMRDPQGGDHWQQGVVREVMPPERLVCTYTWADAQGNSTRPETLLTVTFEDVGGKTKLTLRQALFESVTACDEHRGGWNSSLDRLAQYVAAVR